MSNRLETVMSEFHLDLNAVSTEMLKSNTEYFRLVRLELCKAMFISVIQSDSRSGMELSVSSSSLSLLIIVLKSI